MTEAKSSASNDGGQTVQGVVLSDSDKQAVNKVLRRSLESRRGDLSTSAIVGGVVYVDPPGVCYPL